MQRMQQPDSGWLRALGAPHALPEPQTPQRVLRSSKLLIESPFQLASSCTHLDTLQ
jgi:hypothetical protein